jgi:hypothetical protein
MEPSDQRYLAIVLDPLRVCASYRPKFGRGPGSGLSVSEFQALYRADPFYTWFGLDNPLMYAAHKAAGGMTSIYRQIGIGCERLFKTVLQDVLALPADDVRWSYEVAVDNAGRARTLSLDARIPLASVKDRVAKHRIHRWMATAADRLGVAKRIASSLTGPVFEVRQGYKSKDSKRQNADIANAATAYAKGYLPCAVILSTQIDTDIMMRYKGRGWVILTGTRGRADPQESTYDFTREILGYDLAAFFERNTAAIMHEIDLVLKQLLAPKD